MNFPKYVHRKDLGRFVTLWELFKKTMYVKGSIVECGVYHGGGLMAWAKFSANMEPYAMHRKVIGFDTFDGFPEVTEEDIGAENPAAVEGGFNTGVDTMAELKECISAFDDNRILSKYPKVELVKGDACITIPDYINKNKHLLVSLLFLDFDIYKPTAVALEHLLPRVPKGGIVAFDEINNSYWPGETEALMEHYLNINECRLQKFPWDNNISYMVVGE